MQKAFDNLLKTDVSADDAALRSNGAYRYKCRHCHEEVILAAQYSKYRSPYFRHKNGNNNKECEWYDQYDSVSFSEKFKSKYKNVDFYYDNNTKCFYIVFNFSEEEITNYENLGAKFEIHDKFNSKPFFEKTINRGNFKGGIPREFILEKYASPYYISNTSSNQKPDACCVFNYNRPSFFKVLSGDSNCDEFRAKFVKSESLYTNIKYFVVWEGQNTAYIKLKNIDGVSIVKDLGFIKLGSAKVYCFIVEFGNKNSILDNLLRKWEYNLDYPKNISLLWPPAYEQYDEHVVSSSPLYLYSTIELQGMRNVCTINEDISKIQSYVTRVSLADLLRIHEKNSEILIRKGNLPQDHIEPVVTEYAEFFDYNDAENPNSFYLFSNYGVEKLKLGQKVFLTPDSYIAEYRSNLLVRLIYFSNLTETSLEESVSEALSNFWITEEYQDLDLNLGSMPQSIKDYIDKCKKTKRINTAVKKILESGEN